MTLKYFLLVLMLIASIPIMAMNVVSSSELWSKEIKFCENEGLR